VNDIGEDKLEGEEALNDFFQQIYGKGDPEVSSSSSVLSLQVLEGPWSLS